MTLSRRWLLAPPVACMLLALAAFCSSAARAATAATVTQQGVTLAAPVNWSASDQTVTVQCPTGCTAGNLRLLLWAHYSDGSGVREVDMLAGDGPPWSSWGPIGMNGPIDHLKVEDYNDQSDVLVDATPGDPTPSPTPSDSAGGTGTSSASSSPSPSTSTSTTPSDAAPTPTASTPGPSDSATASASDSPSPSASSSSSASPSAGSSAPVMVTLAGWDQFRSDVVEGFAVLAFVTSGLFVLAWKR